MEDAEREIEKILTFLKEEPILNIELEKVKNKTENIMAFEDMSLLNRANSLAFMNCWAMQQWWIQNWINTKQLR